VVDAGVNERKELLLKAEKLGKVWV